VIARNSRPLKALAALERDPALRLAKADVTAWMQSDDLQVLAETSALIDQGHTSISPPLTVDEVDEFRARYYRRCIRENPRDDSALSRYEAGWELANWLKFLADQPHSDALLARWRDWLADEYRAGDAAIRECLIDATLEHAFERADIKRLFEAWTQDDVLGEAYAKAAKWPNAPRRPAKGGLFATAVASHHRSCLLHLSEARRHGDAGANQRRNCVSSSRSLRRGIRRSRTR
jgi:hypothetical protein